MRKITEYLSLEADNLNALESLVNKSIKNGYEPFGNLLMTDLPNELTQLMVKYEEYGDDRITECEKSINLLQKNYEDLLFIGNILISQIKRMQNNE